MKPFISEVVSEVLATNNNVEDSILVLPSKRAILFFKKELALQKEGTSFSPIFLSIEDFIQQLSGLRQISNVELLFEFYAAYVSIMPEEEQEAFGSFSRWAQVILQDFNEIDRYLVDHHQIFSYLKAIKDLDHWSKKDASGPLVSSYLKFWHLLPALYEAFSASLVKKGVGYQGFVYREANENIEFYLQEKGDVTHYFIGFNALNKAEQNIFNSILHLGKSKIFWDADRHYMEDPAHNAGLFQRTYRKRWKYFENHPYDWVKDLFSQKKNIEIIGVPKNVTQAKHAATILDHLHSNAEAGRNTAIVLADENLLTPMLNAIPKHYRKLNITMGFPLSLTSLAQVFESFFKLYADQAKGVFYYRDVLHLLSLPLIKTLFTSDNVDGAQQVRDSIQRNNFISIDAAKLMSFFPASVLPIASLLFDIENYIVPSLLGNVLKMIMAAKEKIMPESEGHHLTLEYLFRFHQLFNQMITLNGKYGQIKDVKTLISVFRELLAIEKLDFVGEPLEGLQLMGMLETRLLDFENVIITSVNEGILPSGKKNSSFIPFDVKKQFGLPTYKEKDAVYAYHFYRLLQRAQHIFLLHNTASDALNTAEKSRFLMQIEVDALPHHSIRSYTVGLPASNNKEALKTVAKAPDAIMRLRALAEKGFSPSAFTAYIRNPLDFYFEKVLGIREAELVEETVAANTFGSIIHESLELLYKPYVGDVLTKDELAKSILQVEEVVSAQFKKHYRSGNFAKGKNLISFEVAKDYVTRFIQQEIDLLGQGNKIHLLSLEESLEGSFNFPGLDFPVKVKGVADRIDRFNGNLRIIDYKTGKVSQRELNLTRWADLTSDHKFSKAFQVLTYACLYKGQMPHDEPLQAGIFSLKNMVEGFLPFQMKEGRKADASISPETLEAYVRELELLLLELFNPNIPFTEKEV